jgi:uncharacterized membrane protein (UPF0127 family)
MFMPAPNWSVDLRRCVMSLVLLCLSFSASGAPAVAELRIGAHVIKAEVANTAASRAQGLMHRHAICEDCGMLFVFPGPGQHRFWMKATAIPLSIAFLSDGGRILGMADMEPGSEETHAGPEGTRYALEMRAGWFARNQVGIGATVHDIKTMAYFLSTAE